MKTKAVTIIFALLLVAGLTTPAPAQRAYRLTENELKSLLDRIEKSADRFRVSVDAALDKSRLDDTRREDNINEFIKGFEKATDHLEGRFGENRSAAADVEEVLKRAALIDGFMMRNRLTTQAQDNWISLRRDLDELAAAYNVAWGWDGLSNKPFRMTEQEVKSLLSRLESDSDRFRASLDAALDNSPLNSTKTEDEINAYIKDFEEATDRLKGRFDDNQAAVGLVEEVMKRASRIDMFVAHHDLTTRAKDDWMNVRKGLDELALAYNVTWTWPQGHAAR